MGEDGYLADKGLVTAAEGRARAAPQERSRPDADAGADARNVTALRERRPRPARPLSSAGGAVAHVSAAGRQADDRDLSSCLVLLRRRRLPARPPPRHGRQAAAASFTRCPPITACSSPSRSLMPMLAALRDLGPGRRPDRRAAGARRASIRRPCSRRPAARGAVIARDPGAGRRRRSGEPTPGAAARGRRPTPSVRDLGSTTADPRRRPRLRRCSALAFASALALADFRARNRCRARRQGRAASPARRRGADHVGIVFSVLFETLRFFAQSPRSTSSSACSGARRPRCATTRSARRAPSASCRSSPAPC